MQVDYANIKGKERYTRINPSMQVEYGDLWALDEHRLAVADSADPAVLRALLEDRQIDLLLTDPPYGVDISDLVKCRLNLQRRRGHDGNSESRKSVIAGDEDVENAADILFDALTEAMPHLKPGGVFYVFTASFALERMLRVMRRVGLPVRHTLVWVKNNINLTRSDYKYQHEIILYGWKRGASHYWNCENPASVMGYMPPKRSMNKEELWETLFRYQQRLNDVFDVQEAQSVSPALYHPTMKPLSLLEGFVRRSCKPGGLVYDPFGGSCGTLLACQVQGRIGCAVEIDPTFAELALQRYRDMHPDADIRRLGRIEGLGNAL